MDLDLFTFKGRLSRLEFLKLNLLVIVFVGVIQAITIPAIPKLFLPDSRLIVTAIFLGITIVFVLSVSLSASIRRLHDMDRSGWLVILKFVPVINLALVILLFFAPGTPHDNQYDIDEEEGEPLLSHDRFNFTGGDIE